MGLKLAYRLFRLTGLEPKRLVSRKSRVAEEIRQQAVAVKAEHPPYGPRRISDVLKRFFLMRTSPATVHKTLAAKGLAKKTPVKPEKNPAKPRFFERARCNKEGAVLGNCGVGSSQIRSWRLQCIKPI